MMNLPPGISITVSDVSNALGRRIIEDNEIAQTNFWINKALLMIAKRLGALSNLDPDAVNLVVASAVARMAQNPEGKARERIDDYSYAVNSTAAAGEVTLTDKEWELLRPEVEAGAFTVMASSHVGYR